MAQKPMEYSAEELTGSEAGNCHLALLLPDTLTAVLQHLNVKDKSSAAQVCQAWREVLNQQVAWWNALSAVFQYLNVMDKGNAAQVCRVWRDILRQPRVWKDTRIELNLNQFQKNSYTFPSSQTAILKVIRRIKLTSDHDFYRFGSELFDLMPNLNELVLDLGGQGAHPAELDIVSRKLKNLTSLSITHSSYIGDDSLLSIATSLPHIRYLSLSACGLITDTGVGYLAGLRLGASTSRLTLKYLELSLCSGLTGKSLLYLSLGQQSLVGINLAFSSGAADAGLHHLANIESLKEVDLTDCKISVSGLSFLATGNARITSLTLDFCKGVTDDGMRHVAQMLELRELSILMCKEVTAEGLQFLQSDNSRAKITSLNVAFCQSIDCEFLWSTVIGLVRLRSLGVDTTQISDEWLALVARHLPNLHTFHKYKWNCFEKYPSF